MSDVRTAISVAFRKAVEEAAKKDDVKIVRSTQEPDNCPRCGVPDCAGYCEREIVDIVDDETGEVTQKAAAPVQIAVPAGQAPSKPFQRAVKKRFKPGRGVTKATLKGAAKFVVTGTNSVIVTSKKGETKQMFCKSPMDAAIAAKELGVQVSSRKDAAGVPWLERIAK